MGPSQTPPGLDFRELALTKMTGVLGASRAEQLMARILERTELTLGTADDLYAFSRELAKLPAFEGAVGGLLGVVAVMHGATSRPD